MHRLTLVSVCFIRSTCLQGGAVYISGSGSSATFTNCDFTSNSIPDGYVSLQEEHVDEMFECMTLRLCPPCISS